VSDQGRQLLDELLDVLGCPLLTRPPVKLTADLTGQSSAARPQKASSADSTASVLDRLDRLDRQNTHNKEQRRACPFQPGRFYQAKAIRGVYGMSKDLRHETERAGFPRAAIVDIDGCGLLVDDMTRLLIDGRFMVLALAALPAPTGIFESPRRNKKEMS